MTTGRSRARGHFVQNAVNFVPFRDLLNHGVSSVLHHSSVENKRHKNRAVQAGKAVAAVSPNTAVDMLAPTISHLKIISLSPGYAGVPRLQRERT